MNKHRSGLTIPFIIGVEGSSIKDLLTEIANTLVPEKIILKYCNDLNEYVLGLDEKEHSIIDYILKIDELYVYDDILEELKTFDKIVALLSDKYEKQILDKTFSKNFMTDSWEPYTKKDEEFIKEALT